MTVPSPSNPVGQRIAALKQLWHRFRSVPEARICRWLVQANEKKMVEAFLQTTCLEGDAALEGEALPDLFIPFYAGCTRPDAYTGQLVAELNQAMAADTEALAAAGTILPEPLAIPEAGQPLSPAYFLHHLQLLADQLPEADLVVAVLLPATTGPQLGKWLEQAAGCPIPANIRLLVIDNVGEEVLAQAASRLPDQIRTSQLNLNMPRTIRQAAAAGNPAEAGVKFRKAFLALSQAAAAGKLAEVKRLEAAPLSIARQQGWLSMEIAVHSVVASAYIGLNQLPQAGHRYEQAYGLAKKALLAGNTEALSLAVQSLFNKGSVLMARKAFPQAAETYALAAAHAREANDNFQVMEAKRLQGHCLERCREWQQAFRVEQQALEAAALLEEQVRVNSTLPYLGKALLDLAYQLGYKDAYLQLEDKLNALAGMGWQSKLKTATAKVI